MTLPSTARMKGWIVSSLISISTCCNSSLFSDLKFAIVFTFCTPFLAESSPINSLNSSTIALSRSLASSCSVLRSVSEITPDSDFLSDDLTVKLSLTNSNRSSSSASSKDFRFSMPHRSIAGPIMRSLPNTSIYFSVPASALSWLRLSSSVETVLIVGSSTNREAVDS